MTLENPGLSRRKLLRTTAIGVPAAGLLAFGSTLVTATSANAVETDGIWGSETSAGLQRFLNVLYPQAQLTVDGVISSQVKEGYIETYAPAIVAAADGWEWVSPSDADVLGGSPTIEWLYTWLSGEDPNIGRSVLYGEKATRALNKHYGTPNGEFLTLIPVSGLQEEINQWVG